MIFSKSRAPSTRWCMIPLTLSIVILLTATLFVGCNGDDDDDDDSGKTKLDERYYFRLRPRLGHFAHLPDLDRLEIYETYFANVIKQNDKAVKDIASDDWRNARPSGDLCVNFLRGFQVTNYQLSKPYEIIPLDACLNWLFEDSKDKRSDYELFTLASRQEADSIAKDPKLKELYETTKFKDNSIPEELQKKLFDYFHKLLKINLKYSQNGCHSLWLEAYNNFVEDVYLQECDGEEDCPYYGFEGSENDSYLELIAETTKLAARKCYNVMQGQIRELMLAAYNDELEASKKIKSIFSVKSSAAKQLEKRKWSRGMVKIFHLLTGTDPEKQVDLARVANDLFEIKANHEPRVDKFMTALAEYATTNSRMTETENDFNGRIRYGRTMTKLCRSYVNPSTFLSRAGGSSLWEDDSSVRKPFEFYNLIDALVKMTDYDYVYGITKEQFEKDLMKNGWEALYLATLTCQVISTTWGTSESYSAPYEVLLNKQSSYLLESWPIELIKAKLDEQKRKETEGDNKRSAAAAAAASEALAAETAKAAAAAEEEAAEQAVGQNGPKRKMFRMPLNALSNRLKKKATASETLPVPKQSEPTTPLTSTLTSTPAAPAVPVAATSEPPVQAKANLETILAFRRFHKRWPELPPNYRELYPSLPEDLNAPLPEELDAAGSEPGARSLLKPAPRSASIQRERPPAGDRWAEAQTASWNRWDHLAQQEVAPSDNDHSDRRSPSQSSLIPLPSTISPVARGGWAGGESKPWRPAYSSSSAESPPVPSGQEFLPPHSRSSSGQSFNQQRPSQAEMGRRAFDGRPSMARHGFGATEGVERGQGASFMGGRAASPYGSPRQMGGQYSARGDQSPAPQGSRGQPAAYEQGDNGSGVGRRFQRPVQAPTGNSRFSSRSSSPMGYGRSTEESHRRADAPVAGGASWRQGSAMREPRESPAASVWSAGGQRGGLDFDNSGRSAAPPRSPPRDWSNVPTF